jgi:hypothetical protein
MKNGSNSTEGGPLACPRCAIHYPLEERFCAQCGMPLTYSGRSGEEPITESHERARKIKPQYAEGELVRVAGARNQPEAELIQGLLLEEGIPSVAKRARGFDVPDFLAAGPRDIFVAASGADNARDILGSQPGYQPTPRVVPVWVRGVAAVLALVTVALVVAGVVIALVS